MAKTDNKSKTKAEITDKDHQDAIETMRGRCLEMSFTVHGLPKSRRITGKMADQVAASVEGTRRGIRASWSMFTSQHPAVKELSMAIRDLETLRSSWTIVRSATVQKGDADKVTIEGGKRLIWDKDIPEFYKLFVNAAKNIDKAVSKLQHAMNHETYDAEDRPIPSVKDMDKKEAKQAWDESVYPTDLRQVVGVAKERNKDGSDVLDEKGDPKYIITFEEYHVSEKLPPMLRERALQRLDAGLSSSVEAAVSATVRDMSDSIVTFMEELTSRVKVFPQPGSKYAYLEDGEIVKKETHDDNPKVVPAGQLRAYVRYTEDAGKLTEQKVSKWIGPMKEADFHLHLRPQATGEKKKIYPTVIEGIVAKLQAFKDKQSKMLGKYGSGLEEAFLPLLEELTKAKATNPFLTNEDSAKKLVSALKTSDALKARVAKAAADTVEALEEQVVTVKEVHRRRSIKAGMVGAFKE